MLLPIVVSGLVTGSVYGLAALGLVFTYRISRVINYSYGAVAMFCAYSHWQFTTQWNWPMWLSLLLSVVAIPTILAIASELLVYRSLANSSVFARTAAGAAMLLAIYGVTEVIWRGPLTNSTLHPNSIFPEGQVNLPGVAVTYEQIGIVGSVAGIVVLLFVLLRYTMWGVRMRATVVNPQLAQLRGVNDVRVSRSAWIASYVFAAVTGVLLAPLIGADPTTLILIVVFALAAAVLGGLQSLPWALAGGIGLGIVGALILGYVPEGTMTSWASGILPFAVLFVALVVQAKKLTESQGAESKLAVLADLGPAAFQRKPALGRMLISIVMVLVVATILRGTYPDYVTVIAQGVALAMIYLSFRIFTASTGLVSFAQTALAGVGAFTAANLVMSLGMPWFAGVLLGGLVAGALSLIMSLTTVRLRGVFLALVTLAFSQLITQGLFSQESFTGTFSGKLLPRPQVFGDDFTYLIVLLVLFAIIGYGVDRFQYSNLGLALKADLGSTVGAQSIGILPQRGRVVAFFLSATIAGIGGALLASIVGVVSVEEWETVPNTFLWLCTAAVAGIGSTSLMLQIGVLTVVVPQLITDNFPDLANGWIAVFGFVTVLVLRFPGGTYAIEVKSANYLAKRFSRSKPSSEPVPASEPVSEPAR